MLNEEIDQFVLWLTVTSFCLLTSVALSDPNAAAAQQAMLQQQLSLLTYSPYGDSPLFRNQLSDPKKKEEVRQLCSVMTDNILNV